MAPRNKTPYRLGAAIIFGLVVLFALWLIQPADAATTALKASVIQAAVAVVLLYVTWLSIGRADHQIDIAGEILSLEYRHHLVFYLNDRSLTIVNLSKLPVYIESVRFEILVHRVINYSLDENFILNAGEKRNVKLEGIYEPLEPDEELTYTPQYLEDIQTRLDREWDPRYIEVQYFYAGTADKKYVKLFKVVPQAVPWRSEEPRTWIPVLIPIEDYDMPSRESIS